MKNLKLGIILSCCFSLFAINVTAASNVKVPDILAPWQDWVLYNHEEELLCTSDYNNRDNIHCDWPSRLELIADDRQGSFSQNWLVEHERWLQLPGDEKHWPIEVKIDNQPALVMDRSGQPTVKITEGLHSITGNFSWATVPGYLSIPPHTGLVSVQLEGRKIISPDLDKQGRLWLRSGKQQSEKIENRLKLKSFRMIDDRIPARTVLYLDLDVAGTAREVLLGPAFDRELFVPVSLSSPLPARIDQDGYLNIQVRPGRWTMTMTARHLGPLSSLPFIRPDDGFWPAEEIWVFAARSDLRIVEIGNVTSIDPLQTSLPGNWQQYPAYRMLAGDIMKFPEIKRGDPQPAPDQLSLQRNIWLRFDGSGYTIQDTITGRKNTDWRLEINPPLKLGRVEVNGSQQFITRKEGSTRTGVELREGHLKLIADSEYQGSINKISATGWNHDFQKVDTKLLLPPGWRLVHAAGIDNIPRTWVNRWTLLDFFLVLIFCIAVAKLYSKPLAAISFLTLVLTYHEPDAPRWIWLALLIGFALIRYLPDGKFKQGVKVYQALALLGLLIISLPFSIKQLRTGIYPQLEKPWQAMANLAPRSAVSPESGKMVEELANEPYSTDSIERKAARFGKLADRAVSSPEEEYRYELDYSKSQIAQYDPDMILQTGPGLPAWTWNTVNMNWSGPVHRDQHISFILLGPLSNLFLAFTRVFLLILLTLGLLGISYRKGGGFTFQSLGKLLLFPLLLIAVTTPRECEAGEIPSPEMLQELQDRLLKADDCFPSCANATSMQIQISANELAVTLEVDSTIKTAVPLPGDIRYWLPDQITIDGQPATGLLRANNSFWILVPEGKHHIKFKGLLTGQSIVQFPLLLKPQHLNVIADGWLVEGVHDDGTSDNQIQFRRLTDKLSSSAQVLETGVLPPFVLIERTLSLGLVWKVENRISRISPPGSAIVLEVPLLPGESVITEGVRVADGKVQASIGSSISSLHWESFLERTDELLLKHTETNNWTELWRVDVSPIFHLEADGIPVILHQQGNRWHPTWHPWPGEEVKLKVTRPGGVAGQSITIDKSHLSVNPGQRATDSSLILLIRSSQGGQHTVTLPPDASLQEVLINGVVQPVRQEGVTVPIPISPGEQEVMLRWREPLGITTLFKTGNIDLGIQSVNTHIDVSLPLNRWPLFLGGPQLGPAVLFWSVLLVIALVAFGLSRTDLTPLKFHQWLLLGIGMSQSNIGGGLLVVGWLFALDLRGRKKTDTRHDLFNLMQVGIGILTLFALAALVGAINRGLLGHPDMNIVGNGSGSTLLRWYLDGSKPLLPKSWVLSIPMYVYRMAMLAWALWISFTLLKLIKWGWNKATEPVIWYKPLKNLDPIIEEDEQDK